MAWFRRKPKRKALNSVDDRGWTRIFDWIPGAWQADSPLTGQDSPIAFPAVFSCITLISSDIAKLRPTVQQMKDGIWQESQHPTLKLLKKPNKYQNHIQFKEWWVNSKLIHGNAYALKVREGRTIVGLLLLDPTRVTPLVATNGDIFYRLNEDNLSNLNEAQVVVPASEVIHDRIHCLFHPLVGLSPIYANSSASNVGLTLQKNAKNFFKNGSNPGGVLTAPGAIGDETAKRLKAYWEENFTGDNSGKVAALGDGLKYEPMRMTNVDAQMLEHLKWSAETVCSTFHVPAYKIGVGAMPTHNNIEALTQDYYSQCLQFHIESMEQCLDDGLELTEGHRTQLDLDGLFRMDTATKLETLNTGVGGGIMAPDEARARLNLPAVPGGKYPYLQQQNYSLEALAQRDAENPLAPQPPPDPPQPQGPTEVEQLSMTTRKCKLLMSMTPLVKQLDAA